VSRQRVAVVTGGGRGIGAAVAEALARTGAHVVTVDPLVSLEGNVEPGAEDEPTTADRILASGGSAVASAASVTEPAQLDTLFAGLVAEHGGVDAVVNVAGITRPTSFSTGSWEDWSAVLRVHLDGYVHVLRAALEHMAPAGRGRILGVTSGAGWRPGDAGAYSCAKRAVAALTWQVGAAAPPGVSVNALSPIALTRMVTAALARHGGSERSGPTGAGPSSGGVRLGAGMPSAEEIAPLAAHLVDDGVDWLRGRVLFGAGAEVALVDPPRLVEVVDLGVPGRIAAVLDQIVPGALVPAHDRQSTTGGANPRFSQLGPTDPFRSDGGHVVVVATGTDTADAVAALGRRGVQVSTLDATGVDGFSAAVEGLGAVGNGPVDSVVVLGSEPTRTRSDDPIIQPDWRSVLGSHDGLAERILGDAVWARAAAELAARNGRPVRLTTVVPADTAGGRSRSQSAAQLARAAVPGTEGRVTATALEVRPGARPRDVGEVVAHLGVHPDAAGLSGAHLVLDAGWIGLCRHPRAGASLVHDGARLPAWFDAALRQMVGGDAAGDLP